MKTMAPDTTQKLQGQERYNSVSYTHLTLPTID
jgi:hypothetical protein